MRDLDRRLLAKGLFSASLAAYGGLHVETAYGAAPDYDGDCGVTSGSPRVDGFIIWTRIPKASRPGDADFNVRYEVATDQTFRTATIVAQGQIPTGSRQDFTVKQRIEGLTSDSVYYYRFTTTTGYLSDIGRARTAPGSASRRAQLSFGVVSCQAFSVGTYAPYAALARDDIDFAIHLGDHIYEKDSGRAGAPDPLNNKIAKTLTDFRKKYRYYLSDPAWRAARKNFTWIDIWDDHEVFNNYAANDIDTDSARFTAAYQAFSEFMPIASELESESGLPKLVIQDAFDFGPLVQVLALDQRQYRSPMPCEDDFIVVPCAEARAPGHTMLGQNQKAWFKGQLGASPAKWKLALSEVVVSPFAVPARPDRNGLRLGRDLYDDNQLGFTEDGLMFNLDAWDGFPTERAELLNFISRERIKNVVFATGDVHAAFDIVLHPDGAVRGGEGCAVEVVGAAISSWPLQPGLTKIWGEDANRILAEKNPQFAWTDYASNGYTKLTFTEAAMTVEHFAAESVTNARSPVRMVRRASVPAGRSQFV